MRYLYLVILLLGGLWNSVYAQESGPALFTGTNAVQKKEISDDGSYIQYQVGGLINATSNGSKFHYGFPYGVIYTPQTFTPNTFKVSKGYYSDKILLRWKPNANQEIITGYEVYRKEVGSSEDSVLVKSLSKDDLDWEDLYSKSGVLYQYTIYAKGVHQSNTQWLTYANAIGYRTTSATITGRIAYSGGQSVKGATILAESDANSQGTSLKPNNGGYLYLDSLNISKATTENFTFEAWLDVDKLNENGSIFKYDGLEILYDGTNKRVDVKQSGTSIGGFTSVKWDTLSEATDYAHLALVFSKNKIDYYLNGDSIESKTLSTNLNLQNKKELFIAENFKGNIDEIRLWNISLTKEAISSDYNRYISGNKKGLIAYYRANESYGEFAYDLSHKGIVFNENHLQLSNVSWDYNIPSPRTELGIKGISDENGNYVISGIPYEGTGSTYTITPLFKQHKFEPNEKVLFLGSDATIINNVDFKDISSFQVTGTVKYKGTSCYAEDVFVLVDGEILVIEGEPVKTDATGFFSLDMPIGYHSISIEKNGHAFSQGIWPSDGSKHDFQEAVSGIEFEDSTLVKVVGRVVGGTREGNKIPNLGRSKNNIGRAELVFKSQQNDGCSIDTVYTDPLTGEYEIQLPPMNYIMEKVSILKDLSIKFGTLDLVNLTNIVPLTQVIDSVFNEETKALIRVDSTNYHVRNDYIYRVAPVITVTNSDGTSFDGDKTRTYTQFRPVGGNIDHVLDLKTSPLSHPVFTSGRSYTADIRVFETYKNADNKIEIDSVPVTDATVKINNNLAEVQRLESQLDKGLLRYTFKGGIPNTLANANDSSLSFTQTFEVNIETAKNAINWLPSGDIYRAYLLGAKPNGSNFTTSGPELVDFVLRDPPGSGSYSYIEKGTTDTKSESWFFEGGSTLNLEKRVSLGTKIQAGLGVITETKIINSLHFGLEVNMTGGGGESLETSITTTDNYQTATGPELVGSSGDLFVGKSMNYIYGTTLNLSIMPDSICDQPGVECFGGSVNGFKIGKITGMYVVPDSFNTTFIYSKDHIVNYLIPDLVQLRNNFFLSPNYQLVFKDANDDKFGTNNDDPLWGAEASTSNWRTAEAADTIGKSYIFRAHGLASKFDSVRWYNQQIRIWKETLAENDKEKYNAITSGKPERNISFSAGNSYSYTHSNDTLDENTHVFDMQINEQVALKLGAEVNGTGVDVTQSLTFHQVYNKTWGDSEQRSKSYGYELFDDNIGDFFSVDVFESPSGGGPIFSTAGGQSMCPWEESEKVEYSWKKYVTVYDTALVRTSNSDYDIKKNGVRYNYEITERQEWQGEYVSDHIGKNLSEETMRREIPVLSVTPAIQNKIPEHEAATYTLTLGNDSQSGDMQWYRLSVLEETNPDGAILKIDGVPLNRIYAIPGGSSIEKELTLEKGPNKDSYENIQLVLFSTCEYDNWTNGGVFRSIDTVSVSANFIPSCSDVNLLSPDDQWVVNTSLRDTLQVSIGDYNINNPSFEKVRFQYKASSSSNWVNLETFHKDTTGLNDDKAKLIPENDSYITYNWDMAQLPDAKYDIRAVAGCTDAESKSATFSGIYDDTNPHVFGSPQPADGILSPNDEIAIQFNEIINGGKLSWDNFDIRGVLNGSKVRHDASVIFDGQNDYMRIKNGFGFANRSFSIEFWLKRNELGEQAIFTEGTDAQNGLYIGFNDENKMVFALNDSIIETSKSFTENKWKHYVVEYDHLNSKAFILEDGLYVLEKDYQQSYTGSGDVYVGKSGFDNARYFNGNIHELRLWSTVRTQAKVASRMNVSLSGSESGLLANWTMDEAHGNIAIDKVHKRHGELNATWDVYPKGRSYALNGTSDYIEVDSKTVVFNQEMDFTIEFWFNSSQANNVTLLSNGKGDGTIDNPSGWAISTDSNGNFLVNNDGQTFQATSKSYFDGNWHHFALVVNRLGNTSSYIDGELQVSKTSEQWKDFAGAKLWIGARGWKEGPYQKFDNYFEGQIDEVRLWNLARKQSQLVQDKNNRMKGDEIGLMTYIPFEKYKDDLGVLVLTESVEDQSPEKLTTTATGGDYSVISSNIKLARPVEKVNFTFAINGDKIILTPTTDAYLIEKTILDITVKGVNDMNGNILQSPVTWSAYINKNQVVWEVPQFSFSKNVDEKFTFKAKIINSGGRQENFSIDNLPAWLEASPKSGILEPNSQQEIIFSSSQGLNIGNYSQDIYLNTDFSFSEKLLLNLELFSKKPDWSVNPNDFNNNMSLFAYLEVDGVISSDPRDIVIAKINGELSGVAQLEYVPEYDRYLVFLDIYNNYIRYEDREIELNIWDASTGKIYGNVSPKTLEFKPDEVIGSPSNPQKIMSGRDIVKDIPVYDGWTWLSFNMQSEEMTDVEKLLNDLKPSNGDLIRDQYHFATYYTSGKYWYGELGYKHYSYYRNPFDNSSMYMLRLSQNDTIRYMGIPLDSDTVSIDLKRGWNWISYVPDVNMSIAEALSNLQPQPGDVIKGQKDFAMYDDKLGWIGSLTNLKVNQGYMYKSDVETSFTYPKRSVQLRIRQEEESLVECVPEGWKLNVHDFQYHMSMVSKLSDDSHVSAGQNLLLGAFENNNTRGIAKPLYKEDTDEWLYFISLYSNELEPSMNLKLLDCESQREFSILDKVSFEFNGILGTIDNPVNLRLSAPLSNSEGANLEVQVSPNPFSDQLRITLPKNNSSLVIMKIFDLSGRELISKEYNKVREPFIIWNGKDGRANRLSEGVYSLKIIVDGTHYHKRIIKTSTLR